MLWLRVAILVSVVYGVLVALVWLFQERIAFPAPRSPVPDPRDVGLPHGKRIALTTRSGTKLAGWFLAPTSGTDGRGRARTGEGASSPDLDRPRPSSPALLWFYGNGETIGAIWPVLRDYQPPGAALLVVDYPGYGASAGRATESALYEAADAAYEQLSRMPGVDPGRIYVYGRSLGTAVASYTASTHAVRGLILESPFTSAREMSRQHYGIFPSFILRLRLDNLSAVSRVRCPVLVLHGSADLLVPARMGRQVAAAAAGPVEFVNIEGAGHNDTYERGGRTYRDRLWAFVR
jgi:fermentation-respiration switch protein FrsA (DUF1100 family)